MQTDHSSHSTEINVSCTHIAGLHVSKKRFFFADSRKKGLQPVKSLSFYFSEDNDML